MPSSNLPQIPSASAAARHAAKNRQNHLTKPAGALGQLENLAIQIAAATASEIPTVPQHPALVIMAADHGISRQGVSAYPPEVTAQMVKNFTTGGAAANAFARQASVRMVVVDIGVDHDFSPDLPIRHAKIRRGTRDFSIEAALTLDEVDAALQVGLDCATELILPSNASPPIDLLILGEMGIGNTTASAALTSVAIGTEPWVVTGRGSGITTAQHQHKEELVTAGISRHAPDPTNARAILAAFGGLETAGLAGIAIGAAARRVPVVIDGFITGAAALAATLLAPNLREYLIAAHQSTEAGHRVILDFLDLNPLLDLDMRLGEGTGGLLAVPIVQATLAAHAEMATFDEAGVSEKTAKQTGGKKRHHNQKQL